MSRLKYRVPDAGLLDGCPSSQQRKPSMSQIQRMRTLYPLAAIAVALAIAPAAFADDMVSFATGGYARGLRTMDEMHKIDTDGDGKVSKAEWLAYQEKVFTALDKDMDGKVDEKEFMTPSSTMVSFATGGYARGLQTKEMMHRIDTDGDGTVSREEFIAYQTKVFDMMDKNHSGSLGPQEFLGK
jgi:EF-hand domain pair